MRKLQPGEAGVPAVVPQRQAEGRWETVATARQATRWQATVYVRTSAGVRRKLVRVARTRSRVVTAIEDAIRDALEDDRTFTRDTPLADLVRHWVSDHLPREDAGYAENTVERYTIAWNAYLVGQPLLRLPIKSANDGQRLRQMLREIADTKGTATARSCRAVLSGSLDLAFEDRVIDFNAMKTIGPVKAEVVKESQRDFTRAFTRSERDEVIAYADELVKEAQIRNTRTRLKARAAADLTAFMAGTGVRVTEARSIDWGTYNSETGRVFAPGTKSSTAPRWLNLPDWLNDRMKARLKETGGIGYAFTPSHGARPDVMWEQSNCSSALRRILDGAGHEWAIPHTFRRTVASLLDDAGAPVRRIADQLGIDPDTVVKHYLGRDLSGDKGDLATHL